MIIRTALAAGLMLATAAEAGAACNIRTIAGAYEVQITRVDHHLAETTHGTCRFDVRRRARASAACGLPAPRATRS